MLARARRILSRGGWVTARQLGEELGVSRYAAVRIVRRLREEGVEVESSWRGYRVVPSGGGGVFLPFLAGAAAAAVVAAAVVWGWVFYASARNLPAPRLAVSGAGGAVFSGSAERKAGVAKPEAVKAEEPERKPTVAEGEARKEPEAAGKRLDEVFRRVEALEERVRALEGLKERVAGVEARVRKVERKVRLLSRRRKSRGRKRKEVSAGCRVEDVVGVVRSGGAWFARVKTSEGERVVRRADVVCGWAVHDVGMGGVVFRTPGGKSVVLRMR